eukprot:6997022-Alexandrium_andersonii.AAC.1
MKGGATRIKAGAGRPRLRARVTAARRFPPMWARTTRMLTAAVRTPLLAVIASAAATCGAMTSDRA